jgi:Uri superfamily endonuclease
MNSPEGFARCFEPIADFGCSDIASMPDFVGF